MTKLNLHRAAYLLAYKATSSTDAETAKFTEILQKLRDGDGEYKSAATFVADENAKAAIIKLVSDLVDSVEEASDWESISSDESLDAVLEELGGIYGAAVGTKTGYGSHYEDDVLRELIVEFADDVTRDLTKEEEQRYFIAVLADEPNQVTIDGLGHTAEEAIQDALRAVSLPSNVRPSDWAPVRDRYDELLEVVFTAQECTKELYDYVEKNGGAGLSWDHRDADGLMDLVI